MAAPPPGACPSARRPVADALDAIAPATRWAEAILTARGLPHPLVNAVAVCIEEALANLVLHGRTPPGTPPRKNIEIALDSGPDGVTVHVTDACIPFDLTRAADAGPPGAEDMRIGGQGIRLLRGLSSGLDYDRDGSRNRLTLTFGPELIAPSQ